MSDEIERVEENSSLRCQQVTPQGQCRNKILEGANLPFCKAHIGGHTRNVEGKNKKMLQLAIWQNRVDELGEHSNVKSLREEIGICRLMLEKFVSTCQNDNELLIASSKISDLVLRIEKLVVSCHKLERSTGALLDKSAILRVAADIVETIADSINAFNDRLDAFVRLLDDPTANKDLIMHAVQIIKGMNLMNDISNNILEVISNIRIEEDDDE